MIEYFDDTPELAGVESRLLRRLSDPNAEMARAALMAAVGVGASAPVCARIVSWRAVHTQFVSVLASAIPVTVVQGSQFRTARNIVAVDTRLASAYTQVPDMIARAQALGADQGVLQEIEDTFNMPSAVNRVGMLSLLVLIHAIYERND